MKKSKQDKRSNERKCRRIIVATFTIVNKTYSSIGTKKQPSLNAYCLRTDETNHKLLLKHLSSCRSKVMFAIN